MGEMQGPYLCSIEPQLTATRLFRLEQKVYVLEQYMKQDIRQNTDELEAQISDLDRRMKQLEQASVTQGNRPPATPQATAVKLDKAVFEQDSHKIVPTTPMGSLAEPASVPTRKDASKQAPAAAPTVTQKRKYFGAPLPAAALPGGPQEAPKRMYFGSYPQGRNGAVDLIEWRVLSYSIEENKALLVSHCILSAEYYQNRDAAVRWVDCNLRSWLNHGFIDKAFSEEEQKRLLTCLHDGCIDRAFLLDEKEVLNYFKDADDRVAKPTAYCKSEVWCDVWWLRSNNSVENRTYSYVEKHGHISGIWSGSQKIKGGIRPAIWISLDT